MGALQDRIDEILKEAGETIKERARQNLKDGNLRNSIDYKLNKGKVEMIMAEYGVFQDQGVTGVGDGGYRGKRRTVHKSKGGFSFKKNGKMIGGVKSIDMWMYKKGIQGRSKDGRFMKRSTTNFLIRRSIKQHGIKPSLFLTKPYEQYTLELEDKLNALHEEFYKDIENGTNR